MIETRKFDAGVAGAGIVGLAHAYHLARKGLKTIVFERHSRPEGASLRGFGVISPISQPSGKRHRLAMRSRNLWSEAMKESGIWHEETGSLHLAYHPDEAQILHEFVSSLASAGIESKELNPAEVEAKSKAAKQKGLLSGLWSASEICVDPREVLSKFPMWLNQKFGVEFVYDCAVTNYIQPVLAAGGKSWNVAKLFACCGDACETLFPRAFEGEGIQRCKRQMMRTTSYPAPWKLGPVLSGGLSLAFSKTFEPCLSIPSLKKRIAETMPLHLKYGIQPMVLQNGAGELILGSSCEFDTEIDPFDKHEIDMLILDSLIHFLDAPSIRIAAKWHGVTMRHPTSPYSVVNPAPGATLVTNLGDAGMTFAFGLAEEVVQEQFG